MWRETHCSVGCSMEVSLQLSVTKDQAQALQEAVRCFYLISQGKTYSCQAYMDSYENGMQVIKYIGGKIPVETSLVDANLKANGRDWKTATADEF